MSYLARTCAAGAAIGALAVLPAGASAQAGAPYRHAGLRGADVPARVALRIRRAERALARASDHATDGESAAAITALTVVRSSLESALKSAAKHSGDKYGPGSFGAVARAQDDVAQGAADLLDGAGDDLTAALATTLKAALDGHDTIVADVGALSADDQADYAEVLDAIAGEAGDEADAFTEGVSDDTLTDAGKSAEQDAATQATATAAAAQKLYDALDLSAADASGDGPGGGDCPGGGGPGSYPGT